MEPGSTWQWHSEEGRLPLDEVLASRANLAVLRTLYWEARPLWPVQIARLSGLSRAGAHAAIARLTDRQLIAPQVHWGGGRSFPYDLVPDHPLIEQLAALFRTESRLLGSGIPRSAAVEGAR